MNIQTHFIDGAFVSATNPAALEVRDSHSEEVFARSPAGTVEEALAAIDAASRAADAWSATPVGTRAALVAKLGELLAEREAEIAKNISREVGMPEKLSRRIQVGLPVRTFRSIAAMVPELERVESSGHSRIVREPVGVVACITPWNYPLHQIAAKVAPALVAGNTVVLKPSEVAPTSAFALAEAALAAGLPRGVLNIVFGEGPTVGEVLASDPRVDMVSFTGSTRAGSRVASLASATIKRVALELGGKSPSVVLDDADLDAAVRATVASSMLNSGQTCSALTRLIVPRARYDEAVAIAKEALEALVVGDPADDATRVGPLASAAQRSRVRAYIELGEREGAAIITGGASAPEGLSRGYYVQPTLFANVEPSMRIAREEIFGPVLVALAHDGDDDAVRIANDTTYGLAAAVHGSSRERVLAVARRIRAGQVDVGGGYNPDAPFGGMKQSGIGREYGTHGLFEFTELKSLQLPAG